MKVEIDQGSGFCFGVVHAIDAAEKALANKDSIYCLGDIVHNSEEVKRLSDLGLKIIDHMEFAELRNCKVLIRAHGEPPETYGIARLNNIELIDATCPIVLNLQNKIRKGYDEIRDKDGQVVILGKEGHAEVIGLKGQAEGRVIVIQDMDDLQKIDFSKPVRYYAQTTQDPDDFTRLQSEIASRMLAIQGSDHEPDFKAFDSICRQVCNRAPELRKFASRFDVVIFVSDHKSSNGLYLFKVCLEANPKTHFVNTTDEVMSEWFDNAKSVGICGATSTPRWVMEEVRDRISG